MGVHEVKDWGVMADHECFRRWPKATVIVTGCDCVKGLPLEIKQIAHAPGVILYTCPFCGATLVQIHQHPECEHAPAIEARLHAGWNPYHDLNISQLRRARRGDPLN